MSRTHLNKIRINEVCINNYYSINNKILNKYSSFKQATF